MRALLSEALDCIRQAFNGGENAIERPKGKYDPPVCRVDGPTVLTNRTGRWGGSLPFGQTVSRPEDQGEARWRGGCGLFTPAPANGIGRRDDRYHPVSNSLQESTFIVAKASPAMRTRSGYPMRHDLPSGGQRH